MDIEIKRLKDEQELKEEFNKGFPKLFDECFGSAPYFIKYSDEELWDIYSNHLKTGFLLFAYKNKKLVGFAGSRPLLYDEYISNEVKNYFNKPTEVYYHSELGVIKSDRGNNIAKKLLEETIKQCPVNKILMRTKTDNVPSIALHKRMGFEELPLIQKGNGNTSDDYRIYMLFDKEKSTMFNPTNLLVDIKAMKDNLKNIENAIKMEVMPVVKGHAYGIGFEAIAKVIKNSRIAGVATLAEAIKLKQYYKGDVFLMYQPCFEDIPEIVSHKFQIAVSNNIEFLEQLNDEGGTKVHLNIEAGSGMLGILPQDLLEFCKKIKELKNIKVDGIFMHYCCTESEAIEDIEYSNMQTKIFLECIDIAQSILGEIKYKHSGCSSASFVQPQDHCNMARIGLILYGYYPEEHLKKYVSLKPALKLTSKIIQITTLPKDYYVGYNRTYKTDKETKVATISGGYADGIGKNLSNKGFVIVNGKKAPIIGKVCMDICMIDVTGIDCKYDDEVCLFDNDIITLQEFSNGLGIAEAMLIMGQALNVKEINCD
ncbi:MAG: alanine racemase [Bacilli bacterium]|jgi:alanine racemase|nr:alanine racemase [Bacilli bacterium]